MTQIGMGEAQWLNAPSSVALGAAATATPLPADLLIIRYLAWMIVTPSPVGTPGHLFSLSDIRRATGGYS